MGTISDEDMRKMKEKKEKKKGKRERSARKNRRATTLALKSVSIYCTWMAWGTIVWRVCRREREGWGQG